MKIAYSILIALMTCAIASAQATQPSSYSFDVRGIVTDRAGHPIAGADVDVFTGGRNYEPPRPFVKLGHARTDATGRFEVRNVRKPFESAPHIVRATAPDFGYGFASGPALDVTTGQYSPFGRFEYPSSRDEAWIVLRPPATIRGRVLDEEDNPVVDAEVSSEFPIDPVRTDANGAFAIERCTPVVDDMNLHGASARTLTVRHPDFVVDRFNRALYSESVELKLRRGVLIIGRITDVDGGKPLEHGIVSARTEDQQPIGEPGHSNADGQYRLRVPKWLDVVDLYPFHQPESGDLRRFRKTEPSHRIAPDKADQFEVNFTFRRIDDAPATPATRPAYRPPSWAPAKLDGITGKVTDEQGRPIALARVVAVDMASSYERSENHRTAKKSITDRAFSNLSGQFTCEQIDSTQPLLLMAWDATGQRVCNQVTEPGTRSVELRLTNRSSTLSGVIRDADGKPQPGLPVELYVSRDAQPNVILTLLRSVTDANGRYALVGYQSPAPGTHLAMCVESPGIDWFDTEEKQSRSRRGYVYFPVKPGETLDGLDWRVGVPTREEYTREP